MSGKPKTPPNADAFILGSMLNTFLIIIVASAMLEWVPLATDPTQRTIQAIMIVCLCGAQWFLHTQHGLRAHGWIDCEVSRLREHLGNVRRSDVLRAFQKHIKLADGDKLVVTTSVDSSNRWATYVTESVAEKFRDQHIPVQTILDRDGELVDILTAKNIAWPDFIELLGKWSDKVGAKYVLALNDQVWTMYGRQQNDLVMRSIPVDLSKSGPAVQWDKQAQEMFEKILGAVALVDQPMIGKFMEASSHTISS
jgi:hypothetical protein